MIVRLAKLTFSALRLKSWHACLDNSSLIFFPLPDISQGKKSQMSAPLLFLFQSYLREINAPSYSLMPTMSFSQCSFVPAIPFKVSHHGGGARPFASLKKGVKHELLLCSCFQGDSSCSHSKNTTEDSLSNSRCSYYPMLFGSALL